MAWMADFGKRVQQLLRISECDNLRDQDVWLGGMFAPEAYVTATRQLVAQSNGWSLEQLHMHMSVGTAKQPDAFTITGKSRELLFGTSFLVPILFEAFRSDSRWSGVQGLKPSQPNRRGAERRRHGPLLVEPRAGREGISPAARVPLHEPFQPVVHVRLHSGELREVAHLRARRRYCLQLYVGLILTPCYSPTLSTPNDASMTRRDSLVR